MDHVIETLEERPALGIRTRLRITEIGNRIGELMPRLMAVAGPHVAGAPLARWHAWTGEEGEMELAVPVRAAVEGRGDVKPSTLPGGRAVVVVHRGSYEGLKDTWSQMAPLMEEHGLVGRDAPWEEYVDDYNVTPEADLRTRIVWPIA